MLEVICQDQKPVEKVDHTDTFSIGYRYALITAGTNITHQKVNQNNFGLFLIKVLVAKVFVTNHVCHSYIRFQNSLTVPGLNK